VVEGRRRRIKLGKNRLRAYFGFLKLFKDLDFSTSLYFYGLQITNENKDAAKVSS
jgi:hypothetical protein